jgi:hypothetical protein
LIIPPKDIGRDNTYPASYVLGALQGDFILVCTVMKGLEEREREFERETPLPCS